MDMVALIKSYLDSAILKLASGMGGVKGWLVGKILNYGGQLLLDYYEKYIKNKARTAAQDKAKQELADVLADKNKTVKEDAEAYENLINSGK